MSSDKKKMTLEEEFKGYFNYSEEEYNRIWKDAIIVLDTNILLNFYRYSVNTRNDIFSTLSSISKRLWMPYWVTKEYLKNRYTVVTENATDYDKLINKISKNIEDCLNEIHQKKSDNLNCKEKVEKILEKSKSSVVKILQDEKKSKKEGINNPQKNNIIDEKILELFNNSYGSAFSDEEYRKIREEGIRRINNLIPPGYAGKDKKKDENGDYYIFYSMINKSKETKKDIIFITDDVKEDWFNYCDGEKKGGRCELLNEFYKETGRLMLIYSMDGFVSAYSKHYSSSKYKESTIKELQHVSRVYQNRDMIDDFKRVHYFSNFRDLNNFDCGKFKNYFLYLEYFEKIYSTDNVEKRYALAMSFLEILETDKEILKFMDEDDNLYLLIDGLREKLMNYNFKVDNKNNLMVTILAKRIINYIKNHSNILGKEE